MSKGSSPAVTVDIFETTVRPVRKMRIIRRFHSNSLLTLMLVGILTISLASTSFFIGLTAAAGESWLSGWQYRKNHAIDGVASALTNYQVNITLHYGSGTDLKWDAYLNSHCRSDFSDLRFTSSDGTTLLNYWFEEIIAETSAKVWIKVPSIPASPSSATIFIYYGNAGATSVSNGKNTFTDFSGAGEGWTGWTGGAEVPGSTGFTSTNYATLSSTVYFPVERVIGTWEQFLHTFQPVHKTNITEVNLGGYKYWAYYCDTNGNRIGLARSNNLTQWEKYSGNPILEDPVNTIYRWPSVTLDNGIFHMFLSGYHREINNFIKRYTSTDGISFTYNETIYARPGGYAYNPFIWVNPNDNQYYLYFEDAGLLMCKIASTIEGLVSASATTVMTNGNLASPSVLYDSGTNLYWLAMEQNIGTYDWITRAFHSSSPVGGFIEAGNSPILTSNDACAMQFWANNKVHLYYNQFVGSTPDQDWDSRLRIQADTPIPDAGSYRVFDTDSVLGKTLEGQLSTHTTNFVCEYKTKNVWTAGSQLVQYLSASASQHYGCALGRPRGGEAYWYYWVDGDLTATKLSASLAQSQWHHIKRIFNFAEDKEWVYIDDVYQGYYAWREYDGEVNSISYVLFTLGGLETGTMWLDSFRTRQYSSVEITHGSWGSEETLTTSSCDSAGTEKDTFRPGREIWINGSKGYSPSTTYNIFVVTDVSWTNGMDIPTRVDGTQTTVTSNPDGSILSKIWTSASTGKYDVVIDFDGDEKYDEGIDPLDDNQTLGTAGFYVTILGDVNGDGWVNSSDLLNLRESYGSKTDTLNWNPDCDIEEDGKIDVLDLSLMGRNYEETVP